MTFRHGMHAHPVYGVWEAMIQRCTNPRCKSFPNYGGRGISVCESWRNDFMAFYTDMGPRPDGLTLERINNDGDYEPSNCRWASYLEQRHNIRPTFNCRKGHLRTPENTYVSPTSGQRYCRDCKNSRARRKAVTA